MNPERITESKMLMPFTSDSLSTSTIEQWSIPTSGIVIGVTLSLLLMILFGLTTALFGLIVRSVNAILPFS